MNGLIGNIIYILLAIALPIMVYKLNKSNKPKSFDGKFDKGTSLFISIVIGLIGVIYGVFALVQNNFYIGL
jgi:hypothetical protein